RTVSPPPERDSAGVGKRTGGTADRRPAGVVRAHAAVRVRAPICAAVCLVADAEVEATRRKAFSSALSGFEEGGPGAAVHQEPDLHHTRPGYGRGLPPLLHREAGNSVHA